MKLSFVIPAHNEEEHIGQCLRSILDELARANFEAEILVINNASIDRTREIAERLPNVRVVDEPRKGLTRARERGLREAKGDLLAYLDADTRIHPNWIPILQKEFSERKNIVCLSGPFRYYDLTGMKKYTAEAFWSIFAPLTYRMVGYMVLGANFVAKRDALIKMGGFDTNIEFYGEDTNIAWRLSRLGKVVFRMDFFIYGSGRRIKDEGLLKTFGVYAINFLWGVFFHKPFTRSHKDVREKSHA